MLSVQSWGRLNKSLRGRQSQKLLLVWKFTCTNKNGNFVKKTYASGYFVVWTIFASHIDWFISQHTAFEYSAACLSVIFWLLPGLILLASLWHAGRILKKNIYMIMNYSSLTRMYESMFNKIYIILAEKYFFAILAKNNFMVKSKNCK